MSDMFKNFPVTPCTTSASSGQDVVLDKPDWQLKIEKRIAKNTKKIKRFKKEQDQLLDKIELLNKQLEVQKQQIADEELTKQNTARKKWGDTIRKAFPKIISLISVLITSIFSKKTVKVN